MTMNQIEMLERAGQAARKVVAEITPDQWANPTNCDMDVRALVNHYIAGNWEAAQLAEGKDLTQVGHRFEGDVLGVDPLGAHDSAQAAAVAAFSRPRALDQRLDVGPDHGGVIPAAELLSRRICDTFIHAWDLAIATAQDDELDAEMVAAVYVMLSPKLQMLQASGKFGPSVGIPPEVDEQTKLLAMLGRDRQAARSQAQSARHIPVFAGINHLALVTDDMDKTTRFYRDVVGCRLVATTAATIAGVNVRHYFFSLGGGNTIAFFEFPSVKLALERPMAQATDGVQFDHVSFDMASYDDLLTLRKRLEAHGIQVSRIVDHDFVHSIYFKDPNHIALEASVWLMDPRTEVAYQDPKPVPAVAEQPAPGPDYRLRQLAPETLREALAAGLARPD
jgi:uncharacterized protein (TIGR03086 family)